MQVNKTEISLLSNVLRKYGTIDLPAKGTSMFPFIKEDDVCSFSVCIPTQLQRGDIVLFFLESGMLVAHRYYSTEVINDEHYFIFKGDTNLTFDEPVKASQILGKLTSIQRNNKSRELTCKSRQLWTKFILMVPFTSNVLRLYLIKKEKRIVHIRV